MHGIFLEIVVIQVMYIHAHVLFIYSKIELNRQKGEQIQTTLFLLGIVVDGLVSA